MSKVSATIIQFPVKGADASDIPPRKLKRAEIAERARMLRELAAEWGVSITVHGPAKEAQA